MAVKIALAGNPNCGKTTLFNLLTGSNQFVGNWPGVTVEKKEGKLKNYPDTTVIDLPGIYSLSPYTPEEVVTRNFLIKERPDVILNILDGTNLERNLYLTTQLVELGIPVVLAINMMDVVRKNKDEIHLGSLQELTGCRAVEISAIKGEGAQEVSKLAYEIAMKGQLPKKSVAWSEAVEDVLKRFEERLIGTPKEQSRFFAIKLLERDSKIKELLDQDINVEKDIEILEAELDDDAEGIIASQRYEHIGKIVDECLKRGTKTGESVTDRIDKVVTGRIFALPIFALVMFMVYYISVSTVGSWATDWANDGVFGEGWSFLGIHITGIPVAVSGLLTYIGCADWLQSLIVDGMIGGVGAVLGFVPQMIILFAFLAFLEACGYMARVAFIMDRIFRRFGLSGKSFIPMLVGSGCGVPGIMASRTIESDRDRKMAIITTTFIPCGAKLPVIALIAGALFHGAWWVAPSAYFVGIAAIITSGIILKKSSAFAGDPAPFVMELPPYHMPTVGNVLRSMWERASSFIKKAGTVILLSALFIWFTQNLGWTGSKIQMTNDMDKSLLANLGGLLAPLFQPLGWGDWKSAVAAITGLVAKENVVATFGVLYGSNQVGENGKEIWNALALNMSAVAAYSFLVFNLLCAPCFAAIGAIKREMNHPKWFWFAIGYQTLFAYLVSLCIYQFGSFFQTGEFRIGLFVAVIIAAGFLFLLFRPDKKVVNQKSIRLMKTKTSEE